jgi:serine/threonine protein kinase
VRCFAACALESYCAIAVSSSPCVNCQTAKTPASDASLIAWRAAGSNAPLSYSLNYSAPEVVLSTSATATISLITPAADVWALGVMAYELMLLKRAFPPGTSEGEIRRRISTPGALPWEQKAPMGLRTLRQSVLQCLDRDPGKRPTATDLVASWTNLLDFAAVKPTQSH